MRIGGHDIPIPTIQRRFDRGRENFLNLYMPVADAWRLYNASGGKPELIASGDRIEGITIIDEELWQTINNSNDKAVTLTSEGQQIDKVFEMAVKKALKRHKNAGNPVAIWRDGKVVILNPDEIKP